MYHHSNQGRPGITVSPAVAAVAMVKYVSYTASAVSWVCLHYTVKVCTILLVMDYVNSGSSEQSVIACIQCRCVCFHSRLVGYLSLLSPAINCFKWAK